MDDVKTTREYILRKQWNDSCLELGIPSLTMHTAARIMAVVYVFGNNEAFVTNAKFTADVEYICRRFGIGGGETPNQDFVETLKTYVAECESHIAPEFRTLPVADLEAAMREWNSMPKLESGAVFTERKPEWAVKTFRELYGIKLIN